MKTREDKAPVEIKIRPNTVRMRSAFLRVKIMKEFIGHMNNVVKMYPIHTPDGFSASVHRRGNLASF